KQRARQTTRRAGRVRTSHPRCAALRYGQQYRARCAGARNRRANCSIWHGTARLRNPRKRGHPVRFILTPIKSPMPARQRAWQIPPDIESDGSEAEAHRRAFGAFCIEDDRGQYSTAGIQFGERYESSPIIVPNADPEPPDIFDDYTPYFRSG